MSHIALALLSTAPTYSVTFTVIKQDHSQRKKLQVANIGSELGLLPTVSPVSASARPSGLRFSRKLRLKGSQTRARGVSSCVAKYRVGRRVSHEDGTFNYEGYILIDNVLLLYSR